MKIHSSIRTFKLLALALAIGLAQPLFATPTLPALVITENSPTDLSVTYNGSPLTVTGGHDGWLFSMPSGVSLNFDLISPQFTISIVGFLEPENPALANLIVPFEDGSVLVGSDAPFAPFDPDSLKLVSDGTTLGPLGHDQNTDSPFTLTFRDNAGSTEAVPDNGSAVTLLGAGLIALFCVSRRAAVRAT